jgi:DNA-binding LytR/AlgR family response regulator
MIKCLIVDDEPLAQDILETYINSHENLCLVKKCSTSFEAFEILHQQQIDLMFLDVKMPALSGIDFLKSLKNPPAVIFTTAFPEYAVTSYELEAVDYLLKPITNERFQKSIQKLLKLTVMAVAEEKDYTYFKVSGKLLKVLHVELFYAQSIKDYIMLYTKNGNFMVHMTMKYLEELLPKKQFVRIHRSYLINQDDLVEMGKNQVRIHNVEIPIGENYRKNLIIFRSLKST